MNNTNNQRVFRPVYGTESKILSHEITDGYLYIASDTGKIFLDAAEPNDPDQIPKRKQVGGSGGSGGGGSTGFYWGYADEDQNTLKSDPNDTTEDGIMYLYNLSALEEDSIPDTDGLILNADGRFFRVLDNTLDPDRFFSVSLIAVSGGGSGGGSVVEADLTLTIDSSTITTGATLIQGQEYFIRVVGTSTKDPTVQLSFDFTDSDGNVIHRSYNSDSGEDFLFDTSILPENNNYTMKVTVSSDNTSMKKLPSRQVTGIRVIPMTIRKSSTLNAAAVMSGSAPVPYLLGGDPNLQETLHVFIDGEEYPSLSQTVTVSSSERTVSIPAQSHGSHIIGLSVSTEINGVTIYSDTIEYELAWIENDNMDPIIWIKPYADTVIRYENFVIDYQVYDPATSGNGRDDYFSVYIYKKGVLMSEISRKYVAGSWLNLDLTESYDVGNNNYTITCGAVSKTINFFVTEKGSRNLDIDQSESLIMNFSSTGRSNNEISANRPVWSSGLYVATFNNFNWYSNGWLNDNDGNGSYLSVTNGASVTIPFLNYDGAQPQMFDFNNTLNYSFEIRFRIKNVQEYSTLVTTIPYYYVYTDAAHTQQSEIGISINEIKRRQAAGEDLVIAVDDDGNWLMDEANSEKIVKSNEGVCLKIISNGNPFYGLCIGTQEAYLKTPDGITSVRYKEDEVINFSAVISKTEKLVSIYLNGILSGSLRLLDNSNFSIGDHIEINSDFSDIDIYKLRFFKAGLTMSNVIHNYISDKHDLTLYDQNQLTDVNPTLLSYKKLIDYNTRMLEENKISELSMPYAVIEVIDNETGMSDPNQATHPANDDKLPWKKGNNRYCKITFVNPTLDALYNSGQIDKNIYEKHSPSYECIGADINVQGTSSQGYPRRNYKTKHKSASGQKDANGIKHSDWGWNYTNQKFVAEKGKSAFKKWYQDNPNYATNKWTWKIDYMESSGSYNTGFANLIGNNIYSKHPLGFYNIPDVEQNGLRTSVYGFPVLVFHKHSKPADKAKIGTPLEDEIYEYIGRYNLNQDKGSEELFGFSLEIEQPYVNEPWDEEGDDGEIIHHDHPYIADVAECWEMTDNQGTWTSFTYPSSAQESHFATYTIDSYDDQGNLKEDPHLEVIRHYECRYHKEADYIEKIASDEAPYDLPSVNKEIAALSTDADAEKRAKWERIDTIPKMNDFIVRNWSNFERFVTWVDSTDRTKADPTKDLPNPVEYQVSANPTDMTGVTMRESNNIKYATFTKDTAAYRLQKFKSEFNEHLNFEYCAVYFVMTELLLCYDSRGKNMMLASYGPMRQGGDYIWFPIFYDIDTQLGLNNIGATLWDYDTDATLEQTFSTPSSVLWVNFWSAFENEIKLTYRNLRASSKLTYENIEGAYLCDPTVFDSYAMRGLRPLIAIGLDEYYKYVAPSKTGYYDTSGDLQMDNNAYAYAVNGDRILSRELLLRNRLNYIDSCWIAGDYTTAALEQKAIVLRGNANNRATSDRYLDDVLLNGELPANAWNGETLATYPVPYYDGTPEFEITPFLKQYVITYNDNSINGAPIKYQGEAVKTFVSDSVLDGYKKTPGYPEQIIKIPGPDFISELGDLSTKYLSRISIVQGKRLLYLDLGSDAPDYFNGLLGATTGASGAGQFNLNDSANVGSESTGDLRPNPNRKALLRRINFTQLTELAESIDISGSGKLREFRALGTKIPSVTFAPGAPLDTIHLPKSISRLDLTEARDLKKVLTSPPQVFGEPNRENYTGLYIEGITDLNNETDSSQVMLNLLNIIGGSLGYDSYLLMKNMIDLRDRDNSTGVTRARINLENVEWSPYFVVEPGTRYDAQETYYRLTDHNNFVVYSLPAENAAEEWANLTLNEKIFTYTANPKSSYITSLALLDKFDNDYKRATRPVEPGETEVRVSYYTNLTNSIGYPNITGSIFVDNLNGEPIEEADITEKYNKIWPKLKIYAANINESYIAKFLQRLENGKDKEIDVIRYKKEGIVHPTMTEQVAKRTNYIFQGWTTDVSKVLVDENELDSLAAQGLFFSKDNPSALDTLEFSNSVDTFTFYAVFTITSYKFNFRRPNGDLIKAYDINYGSTMSTPLLWPAYNDDGLEEGKTYKFLGWVTNPEDCIVREGRAPKNLVDFNGSKSPISRDIDRDFYACFIPAGIKENKIPEELCRIGQSALTILGVNGYSIDLSSWDLIEGKITLPTEAADGTPYNCIGAYCFGAEPPATTDRSPSYIFWDGTPQIVKIDTGAFRNKANLIYIEWFDSLKEISSYAFQNCTALHPIEFNEGLDYIGDQAFQGSFDPTLDYERLYLPSTLRYINRFSLQIASGIVNGEYRANSIRLIEVGNELDKNNLRQVEVSVFGNANNKPLGNGRVTAIVFYGNDTTDFLSLCISDGVSQSSISQIGADQIGG